MTALSPARTARRDLAILDTLDARDSGDQDAYRQAVDNLLALNKRLKLEQAAEGGYIPNTLEGSIQILQAAATIAERLAPLL